MPLKATDCVVWGRGIETLGSPVEGGIQIDGNVPTIYYKHWVVAVNQHGARYHCVLVYIVASNYVDD